MGYISGKNYGGDFGAYDRSHYGKKTSFKGMGSYSNYNGENPDQELTTRQVARLAERDSRVLPAGLQGFGSLDIEQASKLAIRDSRVLPAGLQGLPGDMNALKAARIAEKTVNSMPNMLGGDDLSIQAASRLAVKDRNAVPAGGSLGYLGEDDMNAFAGLGEAPRLHASVMVPKQYAPTDSWDKHFSLASSALTETGVISALAAAVKAVPDNAPPELKKQYYQVAMEMLKRKRLTDVRHLDLKRVELESNLGWLVNASISKTGGFDKAISKAMGVIGNDLSHNEKSYAKTKKLEGMGRMLKKSVEHMATFAGLGEEDSGKTKLLLVGLGVAIAAACWYKRKKK